MAVAHTQLFLCAVCRDRLGVPEVEFDVATAQYFVYCLNCHHQGQRTRHKSEAEHLWNREMVDRINNPVPAPTAVPRVKLDMADMTTPGGRYTFKVRACPYCNKLHRIQLYGSDNVNDYKQVKCHSCGGSGPTSQTWSGAVDGWNGFRSVKLPETTGGQRRIRMRR